MFRHIELKIPRPNFADPVVSSIINLEKMRDKEIVGDVPLLIFNQLKTVFQIFESLGSARIEGNRTTLSDYIQDKIEGDKRTQSFMEIQNIEKCISYIDECFSADTNFPISERFIKELHSILTCDLTNEGSSSPGAYRVSNVKITRADHTPPESVKVQEYMSELLDFIARKVVYQECLLKVAVAHHRFLWIHPFDNGNGRVARLLTYAMLKKNGFDRISLMNPTAVFCSDRNKYFEALAEADKGTEAGALFWCDYVLRGLEAEMSKINKLLDKAYLNDKILIPTIQYAKDYHLVKDDEYTVLGYSLKHDSFKVSDLREIFAEKKADHQLIYLVKKMTEQGLLQKTPESDRKYAFSFSNPGLFRGVVEQLANNGFVNK